jgi:hypothetical protein
MGFLNHRLVLGCPFIVAGGQRRFVGRDETRRRVNRPPRPPIANPPPKGLIGKK